MKLNTLPEAVDLFLGQYKPSTKKVYSSTLVPMCELMVSENLPLREINEVDVIRYVNGLRANNDYADATIRKHIKNIKTFFNWCVRRKVFTTSPAADVKNVIVDEYIGRDQAMTETALKTVLRYADRNQRSTVRHKALILFLADTGCRAGGAATLQWSQVFLDQGMALVTEKGNKTRPVFFFELATFALQDWRDSQKRTKGDYVFGYRGNSMTSNSLQGFFRAFCIKAGAGSWGPHSLRHRKAHQLNDAGVGVATAASVLGHSPETYMKHYAPRDYDSAREAARKVAMRLKTDDKIIQVRHKKKAD